MRFLIAVLLFPISLFWFKPGRDSPGQRAWIFWVVVAVSMAIQIWLSLAAFTALKAQLDAAVELAM